MIVYSIGVDAGLQGSIALLSKNNTQIKVEDVVLMPLTPEGEIDSRGIATKLNSWKLVYSNCIVTIEKQLAFHSKGAAGCYTIGRGVGIIEGICSALYIPYKLVNAKEWQKVYKEMGIEIPEDIEKLNIKPTKKISLAVCKHLFPEVSIQTKRGRYLDGVSDAILISKWALS